MKLFTERTTLCINKIISTNGFEVLTEVIRQFHIPIVVLKQLKPKHITIEL